MLCCLIFIAFLAVLMGIFGLCIYAGDYTALLYSADYLGNRCGVGDKADLKKAFYPRLARDMLEQHDVVASKKFWELKLYALCVAECPTTFDIDNPKLIADYGYDPKSAATQAFLPHTQAEWLSPTPTVDIANRCIPMTQSDQAIAKTCAYPKCDSAEAVAVGAVCISEVSSGETPFTSGEWFVCPAELGSGEMTTAACAAQEEACKVFATHTEIMTHELATRDDATGAFLAQVSEIIGGLFEIMSSIASGSTMIIVGGVVLPIFLAFLYMMLLFFFAKTIIYGLLFVLIVSELLATFVCFARSGIEFKQVSGADLIAEAESASNVSVPDFAMSALGVVDEDSKMIYSIAFVILSIVTVVTIVTIVASRKQIKICAAIVKEATTVFAKMPLLMFFPSLSTLAQVVVCAWFVITLVLVQTTSPESLELALGKVINSSAVAAAGETVATESVDPIAGVRSLVESPFYINGSTLITVYGFFTLIQFVQGIAWCTMSGAVYYWYYGEFFKANNEQQKWPITGSFKRTMFFHAGSVAFAAFVIALCDLLRAISEYVERQMAASGQKNKLVELAFKVLNCCLYCLKKTVKFVSYYGLVFVACEGLSFCTACYRTFFFMVKNPGQVAINATVTKLLRLVAMLSMPLACAMLFYYLLDMEYADEDGLNAAYPALVIFVVAAVMTQSCMIVFECVITTIFVCCFQDKAQFGAKYMSENLSKAFGITKAPDAKEDSGSGATLTKDAEGDKLQTL